MKTNFCAAIIFSMNALTQAQADDTQPPIEFDPAKHIHASAAFNFALNDEHKRMTGKQAPSDVLESVAQDIFRQAKDNIQQLGQCVKSPLTRSFEDAQGDNIVTTTITIEGLICKYPRTPYSAKEKNNFGLVDHPQQDDFVLGSQPSITSFQVIEPQPKSI